MNHSPDVIRLELPASYRYINLVGACITAMLEREDRLTDRDLTIQKIELAVHETCINIIEHAYLNGPGHIIINLFIIDDPRRLIVDLFDSGIPFDAARLNQASIEGPQERGYGLFLIQQLMEKATYMVESGANHWHLEKYL